MNSDHPHAPVVIITGASSGLGEATARAAARGGSSVVLAARSLEKLLKITTDIQAEGGQALAVEADISQEEDCRSIVQKTIERFDRIDALVNNAGTIEPIRPIAEISPQEWRASWAVNVQGTVMLTHFALPYLRQSKGRVLFITTGATQHPFPGWAAYISAKAAMDIWIRILAAEEPDLTPLSIRPGVVNTPMQALIREQGQGHMSEANYKRLYGLYEQGKLIPPETSGGVIACLALKAPHSWSGELLTWNDEKVQELC